MAGQASLPWRRNSSTASRFVGRLPLEPAFAVFFALAFDDLRRRITRRQAGSQQD